MHVRDCSCATPIHVKLHLQYYNTILRIFYVASDGCCTPDVHLFCVFFSAVSDGATAERQIHNRIFGQIFTTVKKNSVANYAQFAPSVSRLDVLYNALKVS